MTNKLNISTLHPIVRDGRTLQSQADGQILRLEGWTLSTTQGSLLAYDGVGGAYKIQGVPEDIIQFLDSYSMGLSTATIHVRVTRDDSYEMYSWNHGEVMLYYYEPKPRSCNCGAIYDPSFPNHHSSWCDSNLLE